jgi:hypothetical protein
VLTLIERPTLCIGREQSYVGPEVAPCIASRTPGAKVVMIDARHFGWTEVEFNATVHTFLKGIDAG